jgi:hypothetical protein
VQLDRGKWRQGSDEEEDEKEKDEKEKEGANSFASPIPWEDLADEGEPAGGDASRGGPFPFHVGEHAPREPTEMDHPALFGPSEQKEGLKRPCIDEAQPGQVSQPQNVIVRWHRGELGASPLLRFIWILS